MGLDGRKAVEVEMEQLRAVWQALSAQTLRKGADSAKM